MSMAFHRRRFREVSIQSESIGELASQVCAAITVQMSVGRTQVPKTALRQGMPQRRAPCQRSFGKLP